MVKNIKFLPLMFCLVFLFSFAYVSAIELTDSLTQIDSKLTLNPFGYKKLIYEPITEEKIVLDDFMLKELKKSESRRVLN